MDQSRPDTELLDRHSEDMRRALLFAQGGQLSEAERIYRQLISEEVVHPKIYGNLAAICQVSDRLEEAAWLASIAVNLAPDDAVLHFNLGVILGERGQINMAILAYEQALALRGDYPEAKLNMAYCYFHLGDYSSAWSLYDEARYFIPGANLPYARPNLPIWHGEILPPNQGLILIGEQGLGDIMQFIRFAPLVRQWTQHIAVCVPDALVGLVELAGLVDRVLRPEDAQLLSAGSWFPLLSVPRLLGITQSTLASTCPYLKTNPDLDSQWREVIRGDGGFVIGVNWQGNPEPERSGGLKGRSMPLSSFAPLASIPGVRLLSLQKGPGLEQLHSCSFAEHFVGCQARINATWDFCETASIMRCCDLVITTDTCTAHLAGGLGLPTWVLLKHVPDWRWGLQGEQCSWYPQMRVFRQEQSGDWITPMQRVKEELEQIRKVDR